MRLSGDCMLFQNTINKIKKSLGRYFSLLFIILIGVGFYSGIKVSIPNIKDLQNQFYKDTNLMDIKIQSSIGLDDADVEELKKLNSIKKAVGTYSTYAISDENVIKIHAIENSINKVKLITGRMPKANNECLADNNNYKVGDIITIQQDNGSNLLNKQFKVVGTISSAIYTSTDYGNADIGNGKLYSYIFIPKNNFNLPLYTEIYVTINKSANDTPYSSSYNNKVDKTKKDIENISKSRIEQRLKELSLSNLEQQSSFQNNAKWYISDRNDVVSSYTILDSQYQQVTVIANVIPIFFIIIVILMTSNTMTRMIVEQRTEMGTLSSLGITNIKIISSYLFYVLSSTILGTIIGYIIGTLFIPKLVYSCFPVAFGKMSYHFSLSTFLIILLVSMFIMLLVTIISCIKELKQKPAYLLRPVAPKNGKKIILERIKFIWNKLSFSSKITMRNISRYKKRVLMTIIGSLGCTTLIMIGFAIRDSINTIGDVQYKEIFKYENIIVQNNNINDISQIADTLDSKIIEPVLLNQSAYKVKDNKSSLDVYLIAPEDNKKFYDYFNLKDVENNKSLTLKEDGVIITPKIRDRFHVDIGDEITIENLNNQKYTVKVSGISENYVSNYIFMSNKLYKKIFNKEIDYNVIVSKNGIEKDKLANDLLSSNQVLTVNFNEDLLQKANESVSGLNNIVILLVVVSSLLAFTVLYNLTSINISERTREIATLKVLGFKNNETNQYIYRETLITVLIGIVLGLVITSILHGYIIDLLETDNAMFLRKIKTTSYIYSSALTSIFAIIMQIITYFKLKKINMIESLKSVE